MQQFIRLEPPNGVKKKNIFLMIKSKNLISMCKTRKRYTAFFFNSGYPTRPSPPLRIALVKSIIIDQPEWSLKLPLPHWLHALRPHSSSIGWWGPCDGRDKDVGKDYGCRDILLYYFSFFIVMFLSTSRYIFSPAIWWRNFRSFWRVLDLHDGM